MHIRISGRKIEIKIEVYRTYYLKLICIYNYLLSLMNMWLLRSFYLPGFVCNKSTRDPMTIYIRACWVNYQIKNIININKLFMEIIMYLYVCIAHVKNMNILINNIRFSMFVVTQTVMPNSFIARFFENDTSRIRLF